MPSSLRSSSGTTRATRGRSSRNAAAVSIKNGMPREVAFQRYYGVSARTAQDWVTKGRAEQADPFLQDIVARARQGVNGGDTTASGG